MEKLESTIDTGSDGVLTNEAGVISGQLDLRTECAEDGSLTLAITYSGAEEWYTLAGSDYKLQSAADHALVHRLIVNLCTRPRAIG